LDSSLTIFLIFGSHFELLLFSVLNSCFFILRRFLPRLCAAIQPFLPPLSVFVTALCVGSPLAINIKAVLSPFGLAIVLLLFAFHTSSFVAGYHLAGTWFHKSDDVKALQRTVSFETGDVLSYYMRIFLSNLFVVSPVSLDAGMQSSLLALALANKFFPDPLVGVPPAVSVCELLPSTSPLQIYLLQMKLSCQSDINLGDSYG